MPLYPNEIDEIYRQQQLAATAQQAQQSATLETSTNVTFLMRDFPWLSPGLAFSLASTGTMGEAAASVAYMDLDQQLETTPTKFQRNRLRTKKKRNEEPKGEGLLGLGFGPSVGPDLVPGSWNERRQSRNRALGFDPERPLKPVVRTAAATASSLLQGEVGVARLDAAIAPKGTAFQASTYRDYQAPEWADDPIQALKAVAAQTEIGQAGASLARGEKVEFGTGWLPSADSPQAKRAAEAARYYSPELYGGHAWTPGRAPASWLFETDTTPWVIMSGLIDGGVAASPADPTALALGVLGEARAARNSFAVVADAEGLVRKIDSAGTAAEKIKLLEEAGAGLAHRPFIRPKNTVHWLYGPDGSQLVEKVAAEPSTYRNWVALNRKVPIELAAKMSETSDPAEVRALLAAELGTSIQRLPSYRQGIAYNRWLEDVPGMRVNIDNVDGSARNIELALKNAKVAPERIDAIVNDFVGAYGRGERFAALEAVFDTIKAQVEANGAPQKVADQIGRMFKSQFQEANKYWISSVTGDNVATPLKVGNDFIAVDGPMLSIERLSSDLALPDFRTVRRMVSALRPVYENKLYMGTVGVADWGLSMWKPAVLIRPAWTMRVLGEEQVRLAVTGTGLFRHPISYVAAVLGDTSTESRIAQWLDNLGGRSFREEMIDGFRNAGLPVPAELTDDISVAERAATKWRELGTFNKSMDAENWTREGNDIGLGDAVTEAFSDIVDTRMVYLRDFAVSERGQDHAAEALIGELRRLYSDADIQRSLSMSPTEMKAWGDTEVGLRWRRDLAAGRDDAYQYMETNKETWDSFVDLVYKRRDDLTRGDAELVDVLRTGKYNDKAITDQYYNPNPEAIAWAQQLLDDGRGPDFTKVQKYIVKTVGQKEEDLNVARRALNTAFDWLMPIPSNALNRSPDFRIKYWDEAVKLAPELTAKARKSLLKNLDEGDIRLPRIYKQNIRAAIANAPREGTLSLGAGDAILKKRALDHVQELLYDLHKRNQTADVLRLVFPFGEAFKEIVTTWGKLLAQYPQIPRRAQQMYEGAREAQIDPVSGLPTGHDGAGFFRYDPQTRQEVFTYPGSEFLTKALTGVPVPLKGAIKNLNLIGTGLPGVGPGISLPAAWFLPDKPQYNGLRKIIFPFGKPDDVAGLDLFTPAWARKVKAVMNGPDSDRLYANTVFDVARYLNSTGEYDLQGKNAYDEMIRLMDDAKEKAKWLYLVRAGAQASTPSAPAFDFRVEDKSGNLVMLQKVLDDYQKHLRQTKDGTATMDWFIQKYGVDNIFATQPKSVPVSLGITSNREQAAWAQENADQVNKYPNVWALFAPEGKTFDPQQYQVEIDTKARVALSPDEAARRANDRLAKTIYRHAQETVAPGGVTKADAAYLRNLRDQLRTEYPGYGPDYFNRDTPTLIVQLQEAMTDPKLARTDAGKGLKRYFKARDMARAEAARRGLGWPTTAESAQDLRDYLTNIALETADRHPAFARMWDDLLSQEVDS